MTTISGIEAIPLREPDEHGGEETVLVVVRTDNGLEGYGEAVARPDAVCAIVESDRPDPIGWDAGVRWLLEGEDARDPARLWRTLKDSTFWSCRAGVGHCALAGVEMALWDVAGKLAGVPAWQLMGEARADPIVPYVTAYHGTADYPTTLATTVDALEQILAAGYRAAKVESLPNTVPNLRDTIALATKAREVVGEGFPLLLDLGYRLRDFAEGEEVVRAVDELGLWALEAPYHPDQIDDYRRLADTIATPMSTGDQLTAATEYYPVLDSGSVAVVQAGSARTGLGDMTVLAERAARTGRSLVPWGWIPSGIGTSANVHFSAVTENVPLVEYRPPHLYPDALIRRALATPEPELVDGYFERPTAPGLGVAIDWELVEHLRV
jgi:L-alanine-DL-glutamate epimerase-like enolase superfamily enzyme